MFNFDFNPKQGSLAFTTWTLEEIFLIDISQPVNNSLYSGDKTATTPRLHKRSVVMHEIALDIKI